MKQARHTQRNRTNVSDNIYVSSPPKSRDNAMLKHVFCEFPRLPRDTPSLIVTCPKFPRSVLVIAVSCACAWLGKVVELNGKEEEKKIERKNIYRKKSSATPCNFASQGSCPIPLSVIPPTARLSPLLSYIFYFPDLLTIICNPFPRPPLTTTLHPFSLFWITRVD